MRAIQQDQYTYSFWWIVADGWMWPVYGFSMAVLLLFTLGLFTRVTSVLSLLVVISFAHRVPQATFGLDQINAMLTLVSCYRTERAGPLARPPALPGDGGARPRRVRRRVPGRIWHCG